MNLILLLLSLVMIACILCNKLTSKMTWRTFEDRTT